MKLRVNIVQRTTRRDQLRQPTTRHNPRRQRTTPHIQQPRQRLEQLTFIHDF